jgi:hypothetical protein
MSAGVLGIEGRANGTRLPEVTDNLICKRSFGGFGPSSHFNIAPLLNDIDMKEEIAYIQCVKWRSQDSFKSVERIRQTPSDESTGRDFTDGV